MYSTDYIVLVRHIIFIVGVIKFHRQNKKRPLFFKIFNYVFYSFTKISFRHDLTVKTECCKRTFYFSVKDG